MTRAEGVWGSEVSLPGVIRWPSRPCGAAGASVGGKVKVAAVVGRFWLGTKWGRSTRGGWSNRGCSSIPSFLPSSFPPFLHSCPARFIPGTGIFAQIPNVAELILAKLRLLVLSKRNTTPDPDLHVEGHQQGLEGELWKSLAHALWGAQGLLLVAPGFCFPINSLSKTISHLLPSLDCKPGARLERPGGAEELLILADTLNASRCSSCGGCTQLPAHGVGSRRT